MGYLTEIHIQLIGTLPNDEYYKLALIVGDRESLADTFTFLILTMPAF